MQSFSLSYRILFLLVLIFPMNILAGSLDPPVPCSGCWIPPVQTRWQWQLSGTVNQSFNVDMYDIDMFDNDSATVASLHVMGRKVICYISAGSYENWRTDAHQFPPQVIGNAYDGWPGEWWLDIRRIDLLGPYVPFINAGKAVMDTEYRGKKSKFCPTLNGLNINGIRKRLDLDAWRKSCR